MIDERTRRLLDARLAREQSEQRLPSVVAGLARDGELIWTGGRGLVDGEPPGADTQYRAGSITKTFVAVAVLRLRDEGRLSLSDPLGEHLDAGPGIAQEVSSMTIGQLLSHSSGLRAETAGPWWERTPGVPLGELAASSLGLGAARFRPGRRHHYSNVGYGLLAGLVTAKHGRPWHDVIASDLLKPLGMHRTTTRPRSPHAIGYAVHPHADLLLVEPEHDAGAMAGAGQFWTTVGDLALFARFLSGQHSGGFRAIGGSGPSGSGVSPDVRVPGRQSVPPGQLSDEALEEMREPTVVLDAPGQPWAAAYGLGLQLWNAGGTHYYGHTGSMPGFVAVLQITDAPGSDTVVVACNSTAGFRRSLPSDLLVILADNEPYFPVPWAPAPVDAETLRLLGPWYWGPAPYTLRLTGEVLELRREDGDGRVMRFRRDGKGGWRGTDGYQAGEPLVPVVGPQGMVTALDIGSFIYSRTPYDPAAPIPGGVDPGGWQAARVDG